MILQKDIRSEGKVYSFVFFILISSLLNKTKLHINNKKYDKVSLKFNNYRIKKRDNKVRGLLCLRREKKSEEKKIKIHDLKFSFVLLTMYYNIYYSTIHSFFCFVL